MQWITDYSIEKMFVDHNVFIYNKDNTIKLKMHVPSIAEHYCNPCINVFLNIFNTKKNDFLHLFTMMGLQCDTEYQLLYNLYIYGYYQELISAREQVLETIHFLFNDDIIIENNTIKLVNNSLTLDEDLWNYILYVIRSADGMKVEPPRTFKSEADKALYKAQLEREEKIRQIKMTGTNQIGGGKINKAEGVLQPFLIAIKAFPQYKIEDLMQMTFSQVGYLQNYAGKILRYDIESHAYAAGNLKKLKNFWE